jgi:hypothetical protein
MKTSPPKTVFAWLLAPAMLLPLRMWLSRLEQPDFLFGLSSDFYAGAAIGIAIAAAAIGLALLVRSLATEPT